MTDPINPDHYKRLPVEAIDIIEAAIANAPSNEDAYLHGQVLKYTLRCWNKNGIEDLKKAKWYLDRLIDSFTEQPNLMDGLVAAWKPEDGKANQVYPEQKWTPKVGEWVKINKPKDSDLTSALWFEVNDYYEGDVIQVEEIEDGAVVCDNLAFVFEWLEPAEPPQQPTEPKLNSDNIPEGYRKLGDSLVEQRQAGDLRWSIVEQGYIPISGDEIGYANRDNWAACRKITGEVTGEATVEVKPPDGWRFLSRGELIRKGDQGFENGLWYSIEPTMIGMTLQLHWRPILRRNKFKFGEKVVEFANNRIGVVKDIEAIGNGKSFVYHVEMQDTKGVIMFSPNQIAPYIEDAK